MYIINDGLAISISKLKLELQLRYDNSCYHGIITVNDTIIVRTGVISAIPGTDTKSLSGALKDAIGIPEEQLREAAKSAVCKINIDSDLRLGMTAGIREHMFAHPDHFDPRQYCADGRTYVKEIVHDKILKVLGSDNKA